MTTRPDDGDDEPVVRPYFLTRGRTHTEIAVEAVVAALPLAPEVERGLVGESRELWQLCQHPQAVAELAARLSVPIGVARVLVDDLVVARVVEVHEVVGSDAELDLIDRLIEGVRRI